MSKIKEILSVGINSNMLKTIAIIAMVIDHIGFYFSPVLPNSIYVLCRALGRIAMPIFVYTIVQGFFHTKNYKKYILRIGIFAVITQVLITILMVINIKFVPGYVAAKQVYIIGNILFTFVLALGVMKILHEDILVKKWTYNKNLSLKIILVGIIFISCVFIPLDYGIEAVVLCVLMYYLEKLKIIIMIEKSKGNLTIKNVILNSINENKLQMLYLALVFATLVMLVISFNAYWTVLLAIVPISLYNNKRGENKFKYIYYIIFPLQHVLLYSLGLIITLT